MKQEHAFAAAILSAHFGTVVEKVASVLISRGRLTLRGLVGYLASKTISLAHVKKALIVLIQHSIVRAYTDEKVVNVNGEQKTVYLTNYDIDINKIFIRTQFPKYVLLIKDKYGSEGEIIAANVAEHGKLTLSQLKNSCLDKMVNLFPDSNPAELQKQIGDCLNNMITDGFLLKEEFVDIETENDPDYVPNDSNASKKRKSNNEVSLVTATNLNRENSVSDSDSTFWMFNSVMFTLYFIKSILADYIEHRQGPLCGQLSLVLMQLYNPKNMMRPPVMSLGKILQLLENTSLYAYKNSEQLKEVLIDMLHDNVALIVSKEMNAGLSGYAINTQGILEEIRLRHAKVIIKSKLGVEACRIFQILLEKKRLEEKQIQELALLSKRTARELLHKMLVAKFIIMDEIPKSSDRAPSRTFFLFGVSLESLYAHLLDMFYFSWLNLKARSDYEHSLVSNILLKATNLRTDLDEIALSNFQRRTDQLEDAMLRLDNVIFLFRDL